MKYTFKNRYDYIENNKLILENWKRKVSIFEKLSLNDAKMLYKEIVTETNVEEKNKKRERLINGTLYVIINHIENNGFLNLNSNSYDMDDIINSFIERWIDFLDQGRLINIDSFNKIFTSNFYCGLKKYLISDCINLNVDANKIMELICDYKSNNYSQKELMDKIKTTFNKDHIKIYDLINNICNSCQFEKFENNLSESRMKLIKEILISNGLEYDHINESKPYFYEITDDNDDLYYNFEKYELQKLVSDSILTLKKREQKMLKLLYGLDDNKQKQRKEVAKIFGLTEVRIGQIKSKALYRIYNSHGKKFIEYHK